MNLYLFFLFIFSLIFIDLYNSIVIVSNKNEKSSYCIVSSRFDNDDSRISEKINSKYGN